MKNGPLVRRKTYKEKKSIHLLVPGPFVRLSPEQAFRASSYNDDMSPFLPRYLNILCSLSFHISLSHYGERSKTISLSITRPPLSLPFSSSPSLCCATKFPFESVHLTKLTDKFHSTGYGCCPRPGGMDPWASRGVIHTHFIILKGLSHQITLICLKRYCKMGPGRNRRFFLKMSNSPCIF